MGRDSYRFFPRGASKILVYGTFSHYYQEFESPHFGKKIMVLYCSEFSRNSDKEYDNILIDKVVI
jgi:hypothetical protein